MGKFMGKKSHRNIFFILFQSMRVDSYAVIASYFRISTGKSIAFNNRSK